MNGKQERGRSPLTDLDSPKDRFALKQTSYYEDPVCGYYGIEDSALTPLSQGDSKLKIAKVMATRRCQSKKTSKETLLITANGTGQEGASKLVPIEDLLAQYPESTVEVLDQALKNLSDMIVFPSDIIVLTEITRWAIFAHDGDSASYILGKRGQEKGVRRINLQQFASSPSSGLCLFPNVPQ